MRRVVWCAGIVFLSAAGALAQLPDRPHDVVTPDVATTRPTGGPGPVPAAVAARPLALLEPEGKQIYHGVCINAENAADYPRRVARYTEIVGQRPSVGVQFASAFDSQKQLDWDYYARVLRTIDAQGLIPFLKAHTQSWDNKNLATSQLFFKADDILAGKHDAFFITAAQVCRDFKKPLFISWNHEMNGDWYSFSEMLARKRPEVKSDWTAEKYVAFYRRVHGIFKEQGASNVAWCFAPSIIGRKLGPHDELNSWRAYYPGDEYVDWLAPSYYNDINPADLDVIAAAVNKPIFVSEWGSSANRPKWYRPQPYPGDGAWMSRTLENWMNRYPNLKGSGYYQWEKDYAIQRSPDQLQAYSNAIKQPMWIHGQKPEPQANGD